ncbi:hypothetical protein [Amycolatopsis japonica]
MTTTARALAALNPSIAAAIQIGQQGGFLRARRDRPPGWRPWSACRFDILPFCSGDDTKDHVIRTPGSGYRPHDRDQGDRNRSRPMTLLAARGRRVRRSASMGKKDTSEKAFSVRTALVLLLALVVAVAAGLLFHTAVAEVGLSVLTGGAAFASAWRFFDGIIG